MGQDDKSATEDDFKLATVSDIILFNKETVYYMFKDNQYHKKTFKPGTHKSLIDSLNKKGNIYLRIKHKRRKFMS